jgi:pyruvate formate lyase activating enzyme
MRTMGVGEAGYRIKGVIEASFLDWPGRVAAVVFLPGCNFRCPFCHNSELVLNPGVFDDIPVEEVIDGLREREGWIDGVVVTGGEPTISPGLEGLLKALKDEGYPVKLDTNGSRPEVIKELLKKGLIDAVAMDVKAPLNTRAYSRAAGVEVDVDAVARSIRTISESEVEVIFRATAVPGLHDEASVREMAAALPPGRALVLQNFRPAEALDPEYRKLKPFTPEEFARLKEAATAG